MGNHHSHVGAIQNSIPRSNSAADIQDKTPTQLVPIEKLSKILVQKSLEEDSVQGITCRIFTKYVFPRYPDLSTRLFMFFHSSAGPSKHEWLSSSTFKQQTEKILGIMSDNLQTEIYVKMYSESNDVSQDDFSQLLLGAYRLAMDHYPEGPVTCLQLYHTVKAVVDSAFHRKATVPVSFLAHWIQQHCPRLTLGIHRYVIHVLSTAYRAAGQIDSGPAVTETKENATEQGLDLTTPVLERELSFSSPEQGDEYLLPVSEVWLLATVLPPLYTRPSQHHSPASSANGLSSQAFVAKMLGSICPSHWVLLYNSNQHGLGANRFQHHVLSYRGPSLTFVRGEQGVQFCIASSSEWKESHQYWGGEDCVVLQILPLFHVIERGSKLLYLNTSIRGYPKGLRAGVDPRKPAIDVNEGFSVVKYCDIPYPLHNVEVWGCGTEQSREAQLDLKRWQVHQAERQRQVKMTSRDWADHPDKYLLELAGRQSYASS